MDRGVTVLGLGNVLMGDDALGPSVVQHLLAGYDMDARVRVLDLGTPGLDLLPHISGSDALIVADTVRLDAPPGELHLYRKPQLLTHAPPQRVSTHDPGLREALLTLDLHGEAPDEVLLVGVVPGVVEAAIGLSPAVRAAIPSALSAILEELARLGCPARPRATPHTPELWWEQPPPRR